MCTSDPMAGISVRAQKLLAFPLPVKRYDAAQSGAVLR
jgi:hypothetical protein